MARMIRPETDLANTGRLPGGAGPPRLDSARVDAFT